MPIEFVEPPAVPRNLKGFTAEDRQRGSAVARKERAVTPELLVELARANGRWARVATGITSSRSSAYRTYAAAHPAIGLEVTTRANADDKEMRDVYMRLY